MHTVPPVSGAGRAQDLSVHMCFICLLHLANEKGLCIEGAADLTTLNISAVPSQ
jgi:condensin complex subunit 2